MSSALSQVNFSACIHFSLSVLLSGTVDTPWDILNFFGRLLLQMECKQPSSVLVTRDGALQHCMRSGWDRKKCAVEKQMTHCCNVGCILAVCCKTLDVLDVGLGHLYGAIHKERALCVYTGAPLQGLPSLGLDATQYRII